MITDIDIITGQKCPYCTAKTQYVDSIVIYGTSYGMVYWCKPCDAYVGVHKSNPKEALGRLANRELRAHKKQAHLYFDKIWQQGHMKRHQAYKWLSEHLDIHKDFCHIGMFDVKECTDTVYFSKQFLNDMRRLDLDMGAVPDNEYFEIN